MRFKNHLRIYLHNVERFWKCIDSSESIKTYFDYYENVLVAVQDKFSKCEFTYFKSDSGKCVRIIDEKGKYLAVIWKKPSETSGECDGERGLRKFIQTLNMFEKAIETGKIDIHVTESPYRRSQYVPLTYNQQIAVGLYYLGESKEIIMAELNLDDKKFRFLREELYHKGYTLFGDVFLEEFEETLTEAS